MRRELVQRLERALSVIKRDLVFDDIAGPLIELGVIAVQDVNLIRASTQDALRCGSLIDVLCGKEDAAFDKFVNILKVDHSWLAEEILQPSRLIDVPDSVPVTNEAQNGNGAKTKGKRTRLESRKSQRKRVALGNNQREDSEPENNERMAQGVTQEMVQLIRKNHRTTRDWTNLAHALGLTRLVNKIRVKVLVFGEDLDGCVAHLLQEWMGERPEDANLMNLVKALRGEGFNDVADELMEKFTS